jgi:nicotinamide-nucleotide amidase
MFDAKLIALAEGILNAARAQSLRIATAESCTGGLVAAVLTEIAGSSDVFGRGYVTYSNRSKEELLGVPGEWIAELGAVSEPVSRAMAEGALKKSGAHLALAVTGIAGPGGGTEKKPVGLVHFAAARTGRDTLHVEHRFGEIGRSAVRMKSVEAGLLLLQRLL